MVSQPSQWVAKMWRLAGKILFNLIPLIIAAVFFWLQAQIERQGGSLSKFELSLTVVFELALVFIWSLFLEGT